MVLPFVKSHVCGTADFAKDTSSNSWKRQASSRVTDSIIDKYSKLYGFSAEYAKANRHLFVHFADMEEKSRDRQANARPMTIAEMLNAGNIIAKEYFGYNNAKRLLKGIDPVTGEKANRWIAGGELTFDLASTIIPPLKAGKVTKVGKLLDAVDDVSKTIKSVDNIREASRTAQAIDTVNDTRRAVSGTEAAEDFVKGLEEITNSGSLAKNFQSSGGFNQALKDFDSLDLIDVKEISTAGGLGKVGKLSDGTKVVVRPISKEGSPTIEFQFKVPYKIRY